MVVLLFVFFALSIVALALSAFLLFRFKKLSNKIDYLERFGNDLRSSMFDISKSSAIISIDGISYDKKSKVLAVDGDIKATGSISAGNIGKNE